MLSKLFFKLFGLLDQFKAWLLNWGIKLLIVFFILVIVHNVLKISEISTRYSGEYKNLWEVYEEKSRYMNIYITGDGPRTVVILPEFGSQSPAIQYKAVAQELNNNYKVAIVEYFGYGYSMGITKERSNENIAFEIKTILENSGVQGPYIFVAHDSSNVYAMKFQIMYPDKVSGIISLDGIYPKEINDRYLLKKRTDMISNINYTSIVELSGYERALSYIMPQTFYIDRMKNNSSVYSNGDIKVLRNRIGSSYLTRTMVREANHLIENEKEMEYYKYPDYLPVLEILTTGKIEEFNGYMNAEGGSKINLQSLAESYISNSAIQSTITVDADAEPHLTNPIEVANAIRSFLVRF